MAFLKPDGSSFDFFDDSFLGCGTTGIVLRHGRHALKIPKIRNTTHLLGEERELEEYVNDANRNVLEREKDVYLRVGHCHGIPDCIQISEEGILMACFKRGDLETYMKNEVELDPSTKAKWILSVIKTVYHFHDSKVLIDDIAP